MTHAYQEIYLSKAQALLGEALDYAVNSCHIPGDNFVKQFTASSFSRRLENGDPTILAGKSGIEFALDIIEESSGSALFAEPIPTVGRTPEYWIGWAIAYYQWLSGRTFRCIFQALPFEALRQMYVTLHEADVSKFAEIAEKRLREMFPETGLKRFRTAYGYTQAALAQKAGIRLRSIQMYEQRNKDINKASADTLYRIAKTLGCRMEDLMEPAQQGEET